MNIDLNGKTALVTGGSRGIGAAICMGLARAGASVAVNYVRNAERAEELVSRITEAGGTALAIKADVSEAPDVEALFKTVKDELGGLDILVNNAGVIKDTLLAAMDLKDWQRIQDVNLRSVFLCSQAAVQIMMAEHSGAIVNLSSTSAIMGGRGQCNYAASKGGVVSFTRAAAVELAGKGIRVNAVLPGMVVTEMSARIRKRAGDALLARIPLARFGEPHEVASMVVFLASDEAAYITGQSMVVDGGLSIS